MKVIEKKPKKREERLSLSDNYVEMYREMINFDFQFVREKEKQFTMSDITKLIELEEAKLLWLYNLRYMKEHNMKIGETVEYNKPLLQWIAKKNVGNLYDLQKKYKLTEKDQKTKLVKTF